MEEDSNLQDADHRVTVHTSPAPENEGYVSPEVAAARAGEQVEFGVDLTPADEDDDN